MRSSAMRRGCALVIVACAWGVTAQATPPVPAHVVAARPAGGSSRPNSGVAGLGSSVDQATLARMSGGTNVTESITVSGSVSNTSTSNVSTGYNWIGGGAFGNAAGLPMVIQNSGNSVLIQNATVVNVQLQP